MLRRPPPPPQRLPPFRLHYPTHAGNMLSSIPPPYEMAFPAPQPKKKGHPVVVGAIAFLTTCAIIAGGLWGWRTQSNVRAREKQLARMHDGEVAETRALLSAIHDRFPLGLTEESACDEARIPDGARTPLLSFSQLRAGDAPSPAEALLQPTSFVVGPDTTLKAPVVAVLMTNAATLQPGSYDGWIVVFDRQATPLCHARVVAKSDGGSFVDLKNQLRGAERAAAMRLSQKLAVEL